MLKRLLHAPLDAIYKPKWLKNVLALRKSAHRFLNYKRDLLAEENIVEINAAMKSLDRAINQRDKTAAQSAADAVESVCQTALPRYKSPSGFRENVEIFIVTIIIFLGIRAYIIQPFRIPTGSMQPTLNGIESFSLERSEWPALPTRLFERAARGRNYIYVEAEKDLKLRFPTLAQSVVERQAYLFFTFSDILLADGSVITVNASRTSVLDPNGLNLGGRIGARFAISGMGSPRVIPKGTVMLSGYSDSGDMIIVDRVSYHFRRPIRGEVVVFDTRGIRGVHEGRGPQGGGYNYIKRLAGVPGDNLSIGGPDGDDGQLYIDGQPATEFGFRRVAEGQGDYPKHGYILGKDGFGSPARHLRDPSDVLSLSDDESDPIMQEYAALGDNTDSSLDSRYWGSVKEYNLVGSAWFSLWPFTSGHWGFIK